MPAIMKSNMEVPQMKLKKEQPLLAMNPKENHHLRELSAPPHSLQHHSQFHDMEITQIFVDGPIRKTGIHTQWNPRQTLKTKEILLLVTRWIQKYGTTGHYNE